MGGVLGGPCGDLATVIGSHPVPVGAHLATCPQCPTPWRVLTATGIVSACGAHSHGRHQLRVPGRVGFTQVQVEGALGGHGEVVGGAHPPWDCCGCGGEDGPHVCQSGWVEVSSDRDVPTHVGQRANRRALHL